jgi:hypothetical protein
VSLYGTYTVYPCTLLRVRVTTVLLYGLFYSLIKKVKPAPPSTETGRLTIRFLHLLRAVLSDRCSELAKLVKSIRRRPTSSSSGSASKSLTSTSSYDPIASQNSYLGDWGPIYAARDDVALKTESILKLELDCLPGWSRHALEFQALGTSASSY